MVFQCQLAFIQPFTDEFIEPEAAFVFIPSLAFNHLEWHDDLFAHVWLPELEFRVALLG